MCKAGKGDNHGMGKLCEKLLRICRTIEIYGSGFRQRSFMRI